MARGCGTFWFCLDDWDPSAEDPEASCRGWHRCCFEGPHEGAHLCEHGHFCEQVPA